MPKIFTVIALLFFFVYTSAHGQSLAVSGVIKDSVNHEALIGVNISLVNQENRELKYFATTDLEGRFVFAKVKPAPYLLTATYVGYAKFQQRVNVKEKAVQLGSLYFSPDVQMMEGVVIVGKASQSVLMGDTTHFNADAFKTAPDASGQDLIEKLPGVVVQDGKLQAQGEDVQQILVDGKPFFGGDVNAALQNLPADVIAGVEVFDKKSDKAALTGFDDGEASKTINIVTKPNRRKGEFGKATVGYGTDNRYQLGASVNFFNGDRRITVTGLSNNINAIRYSADPNSQGESRTRNGIITTNSLGLNFSDEWGEKLEISGSYQFSHRQNESTSSTFRNYILAADSGQVYKEERNNDNTNIDQFINMKLEYTLDSNNTVIMRPNISLKSEESKTSFFGRTEKNHNPLNQTENISAAENTDNDFNNSIYYSHRFAKKGRSINFGLNAGYHANSEIGERRASNIYFNEEDSVEMLNQKTRLSRTAFSWELNASYTEPVGKNGQLELEYETGDKLNDSDKLTYNIIEQENNNISELDTALSNTFQSRYMTSEFEIGYQYKNEKMRIQIEGEYQHAGLKNDQEFPEAFEIQPSFASFLPTVRFDYNFSKGKRLEFDYDTRTNEPSIGQLQNVIDNSNPLHIRTGNPGLDQSYANRFRLRYKGNNPETNQSLFIFLGSELVQNNITNSSTIAEAPIRLSDEVVLAEGSQLTRPVNIDGYWNFHSYLSYGKPWELIKSNFNINGSVGYTKSPGMVNDQVNLCAHQQL